jgi:hypothetical protein
VVIVIVIVAVAVSVTMVSVAMVSVTVTHIAASTPARRDAGCSNAPGSSGGRRSEAWRHHSVLHPTPRRRCSALVVDTTVNTTTTQRARSLADTVAAAAAAALNGRGRGSWLHCGALCRQL